MESKKSRLKLRTKTTSMTKQDGAMLAAETLQQQRNISDNQSEAEQVIEILDDSDNSVLGGHAVVDENKKSVGSVSGDLNRHDIPLETLRQVLLSICSKRGQVPWETLPDLPPYQPFIPTKETDACAERLPPADNLLPLPKPCRCMIQRKRGPQSKEMSEDHFTYTTLSGSVVTTDVYMSNSSAAGQMVNKKESCSEFSGVLGVKPVLERTNNNSTLKPEIAVSVLKPSHSVAGETNGKDLRPEASASENVICQSTDLDNCIVETSDFETDLGLPTSAVFSDPKPSMSKDGSAGQSFAIVSGVTDRQKQTDNVAKSTHGQMFKALSADQRNAQPGTLSTSSKQPTSQPNGNAGKRKSLFGDSGKRSQNRKKTTDIAVLKQPRIEIFGQTSAHTRAVSDNRRVAAGTVPKTQAPTEPRIPNSEGRELEPKTNESNALSSCPLCQVQFTRGMTQLEIDGHIAACLSACDGDVVW